LRPFYRPIPGIRSADRSQRPRHDGVERHPRARLGLAQGRFELRPRSVDECHHPTVAAKRFSLRQEQGRGGAVRPRGGEIGEARRT
jgi:hypothetical protein